MSNTTTRMKVVPSAAPTPEELAEWHALSRDEQEARLAKALEEGFDSPSADCEIGKVIAEAKATLSRTHHG